MKREYTEALLIVICGVVLIADESLNFLPKGLGLLIVYALLAVCLQLIIRDAVAGGIRKALNEEKISTKIAHIIAAGIEQPQTNQQIEAEILAKHFPPPK